MRLILPIIFILLLPKFIFAQIIAVVNVQFLIDNNINYIAIIDKIENNQKKFQKKFENKENELKKLLDEIEESKLILNENEINIKIDKYNEKVTNYTNLLDEFNIHYQNEIIKIREKIFKQIIVLLEKYAIKNNVDLIIDSANYLIASNSIEITDNINNELKKINIKLEYKDFENN